MTYCIVERPCDSGSGEPIASGARIASGIPSEAGAHDLAGYIAETVGERFDLTLVDMDYTVMSDDAYEQMVWPEDAPIT